MKRCVKCKQWKDESEFSWRYEGRRILQKACKACRKEENSQWYDRHKDEHRDNVKQRKTDAIKAAQRFIYDYLSNSTCKNCGEYDFAVLTFHHVRGAKKMDISQMVAQGYSIEAIKDEIEKCIVLCASCHMRAESEKSGGRFRKFWPPWEN